MLRWFLRGRLNAEEKKLGESVDYLRHINDVSPFAFLRFASILPLANCRTKLPKEAWFAAQIVASRHEDCGPCLQITVNLAQQAGVEPELIQHILNDEVTDLPPDIAEVYRFTNAVVNNTGDEDELRESIRNRYGELALIELAYAIASCRIPPTVKRVLGFAKSCSVVKVEVKDRSE